MNHDLLAKINNLITKDVDRANEKFDIIRTPSKTEQDTKYHERGYYILHCAHDKYMWHACNTCHRKANEVSIESVLVLVAKCARM